MSDTVVQASTSRRLRILFIGAIQSTHAQSWIRGVLTQPVDARAFSTEKFRVPHDVGVGTYVQYRRASAPHWGLSAWQSIYHRGLDSSKAFVEVAAGRSDSEAVQGAIRREQLRRMARRLGVVLRDYKPHVVHIFGLSTASREIRRAIDQSRHMPRKVVQVRGGADVFFQSAAIEDRLRTKEAIEWADVVLADNPVEYARLRSIGARVDPPDGIDRVPGTGGIDLDDMMFENLTRPSERRMILCPKGYEGLQSKILPVVEALQIAWRDIQPCSVTIAMAVDELPQWVARMPLSMRSRIELHGRVSHRSMLDNMRNARVMLAPSLVDGTPNVMWEAMACGAAPIVSPLDSIVPFVSHENNVLLARNLYPNEIAEVLVRAMTDDSLVDDMAEANIDLVRRLANRAVFMPRIVDMYRSLAAA